MSMKVFFRRLLPLVAVAGLALGASVSPVAVHASGGLISVTSTSDVNSCPNGPGEPGFTLRCAITYENTNGGGDIIIFRISATGPVTITLRSALPALVVSSTQIDGYELNTEGSTQNTNPLANGDNASLDVTVNGAFTPLGTNGLVVSGSNDAVRGLRLVGFRSDANNNGGYAVALEGPGSFTGGTTTGDVVEGNFIGNVFANPKIIPNGYGVGVFTSNDGATIGGATPAQANVISGNVIDGVQSTITQGTVVEGNYIGTDITGTVSVPNATGVAIVGDSNDVIGAPSAGNVISGNSGWGINMSPWQVSAVVDPKGGLIQGNLIGVQDSQSAAVPNGSGGIELNATNGTTVGGVNAGDINVISGNNGDGVYMTGAGSNNTVEGNDIGITTTGYEMGNTSDGVQADAASTFDAVGVGGVPAASNTIAANGGFGVDLGDSATDPVHVSVNLNTMYANSNPGVNLNGQDQLFCTAGMAYVQNTTPNDLTPCPLVLGATPDKIIGEACTACTVEIYLSPGVGDDEGQTLIGTVQAGSCPASAPCQNFSPWTLPSSAYQAAVATGDYITATATSTVQPYYPQPAGAPAYAPQTSSFSRNVPVGQTLVVNTTQDLTSPCTTTQCSLRAAITQANTDGQGDEIDFNVPSGQCSPGCNIDLQASALPPITAYSTFINGYTQPNATPNSNTTLAPGDNATIPIQVVGVLLKSGNGIQLANSYDSVEGLQVGSFAKGDGFLIGQGNAASWFDIVAGCYVGTFDGQLASPNQNGVEIESPSAFATVGGRAFMDDNVIGGNSNFGVLSSGFGGNTLRENLIGVQKGDIGGNGNGYDGVLLFGTHNDVVGGIRPDETNVIDSSFNNGIEGLDAKQATILQNEIGVDGKAAVGDKVGNGFAGVFLYLGANNLVGDLPFGVGGNVIAGNAADGVDVLAETGDLVAGNVVGVVQPNGGNGVMVGSSTYVTGLKPQLLRHSALSRLPRSGVRRLATVGGETPIVSGIQSNIIAGNGKQGVLLGQSRLDGDVHVAVNLNSMFQNVGGGGIQFFGGGRCYAPPKGVNDAIACPVVTNAGGSTVAGTACLGCEVEVFTATNVGADNGAGEGQVLLGVTSADGSGKWALNLGNSPLKGGTYVTATQSQYLPGGYQAYGGYYLETSQFAFNFKAQSDAGTRFTAKPVVKLHQPVNWAALRALISHGPKAWPHYHVRFRPLKP